jgi:RHS repeat-associated protein
LTDATGAVTYSARYTPWGDTLEASGTGNLTFGYFGGLMDAATGLLYVGDGQYYDPSTGSFLTRNAKPYQTNPYLPFDPTGAMLGHIRNFNEHPAGQNFICIMLNCPLGMAETAES